MISSNISAKIHVYAECRECWVGWWGWEWDIGREMGMEYWLSDGKGDGRREDVGI